LIIFVLILLFLTFFFSRITFTSYINPFILFVSNLLFALAIFYSVDFIDHTISEKTFSILIISIIAFSFGTILAVVVSNPRYKVRGRLSKGQNILEGSRPRGLQLKDLNFIRLLFWISMIGFVYYLYVVQSSIGIVNVLSNPNLLNLAIGFDEISFSSIPTYMMKISTVNSMLILIYILKFKPKFIGIYVMYFLEIAMNISVKRDVLVHMLVLNILVYLYYNSDVIRIKAQSLKQNSKTLKGIILALCIIFFAGYYFATTQRLLNKEVTLTGSLFGLSLPSFIVTIILYYAANFKSFDIYLLNESDVPLLGGTLRFLYKGLDGVRLINYDDSFLSLNFVSTPELFNTTLGQYYIYSEGGLIWTIIFYSSIGFIATMLYLKYQKDKSETTLMLLALISTLLLFSIREYLVIFIDFWISLLIIFTLHIRLKKRKRGVFK
jgi:oligosaccharide repeat unit polymerase